MENSEILDVCKNFHDSHCLTLLIYKIVIHFANSEDLEQTAPKGAVCSWSTLIGQSTITCHGKEQPYFLNIIELFLIHQEV